MLFHSFLEPASGVYVEQLSLTLCGDLDAAAFEGAWHQAARRHATLRTAFVWENLSEPLQLVRQDVKPPCLRDDWRGGTAEEDPGRGGEYPRARRGGGVTPSPTPVTRLPLISPLGE